MSGGSLDNLYSKDNVGSAKNIILNMKDTLHDAEWYISGDYDEDEFLAAVKKYNANPE